jgi:hypothetical protein
MNLARERHLRKREGASELLLRSDGNTAKCCGIAGAFADLDPRESFALGRALQ